MDVQIVSQNIEQLVASLQQQGVLDEQFSQLLQLQDESNPDFVAEVVSLYFDDSVTKIERMGVLLGSPSPNFTELDAVVHQFKGSSASLGAQTVCQLCIRLREACQMQNAASCGAVVQQIREAFSTLKTQLDTFMALETQRKALLARQ